MDVENVLEEYGDLVEENVKEHFESLEQKASEYHPFIAQCYSDLEEFVLRKGKRLASCSTLLTYKGYTGGIGGDILTVSTGIELYRHAILIHDDMIDMDTERRGGKTLHQTCSEKHGERFGRGTATFLGNIAFGMAEQVITESEFPREEVSVVLSLLADHYRQVNESQILDLLFEYKDVGVGEWHAMASKRAASLFKLTVLTGATFGGAPEKDLKTLEKAGENMGYSFDIQDDIIDTFAEREQYGRKPCRDIRLGKKPLHVIQALNSGNPKESEELKNFLNGDSLDQEDIKRIRELIRGTGGLEAAGKTSEKHADKAKKLIEETELDDETKSLFESLIDYVQKSLKWYE